jgi:hypothetical protein
MRHYKLEQWVDFVRNVIDEGRKKQMQEHLDSGCKQCSKELSMWQRLQQVARRESTQSPSSGAVRTVNASFANPRAQTAPHAKSGLASVLFDSFRSPLLAGIRSAGNASQQVLYGAGTYRIDVRIEPQMDSEKVILVGQVLNSADPEERLSEMPVTLWKGRKVLAESRTSQFGEFQIECQLDAGYRLVVMLPGGAKVALRLIDPTFGRGADVLHTDDVNRVRRNLEARKKSTRTNG